MVSANKIAKSPERSFGITFAIFFFIVACVRSYKHGEPSIPFFTLSVCFLVLGLVIPSVLKYPNKIWMKFGELLHKITTPIILGLMFFGVFLPIGFLLRSFRILALQMKYDPKSNTYWQIKEKPGPEPETMKFSF